MGKQSGTKVINNDPITQNFGNIPGGTMTYAMRNRMAKYDSLQEVYNRVSSEDGMAKFNKNAGNIEKSYSLLKSEFEKATLLHGKRA